MNRTIRLFIALAALVALSAPALAAENWPDSVNNYVAQVRKTIKTTDMDGYLAVVKNSAGAILLDVREENEFKAGHVPGAINIPRGLLESWQIWKSLGYPNKVDTNRKIYVQCVSGNRATLATRDLKNIGFTNATAVIMRHRRLGKEGLSVREIARSRTLRGAGRGRPTGSFADHSALQSRDWVKS